MTDEELDAVVTTRIDPLLGELEAMGIAVTVAAAANDGTTSVIVTSNVEDEAIVAMLTDALTGMQKQEPASSEGEVCTNEEN